MTPDMWAEALDFLIKGLAYGVLLGLAAALILS